MNKFPGVAEYASRFLRIIQLLLLKRKHQSFFVFLLVVCMLLFRQAGHAQQVDESIFDCNLPAPFVDNAAFDASIVSGTMPGSNILNIQRWTGAFGANVGSVGSPNNATDANLDNTATMSYVLSVTGGQRLTVESNSGIIPAGYFAGFAIRNAAILDVSVLGSFTIKTYLGDVFQEGINGNSGSLAAKLLNDNGINQVGFVTTKSFNRIMIEQNQEASVALGTTEIFYAVVQKFCAETQPRPCNELEYWTNPEFPVYANQSNTGISGGIACANCEVKNINLLVDSDTDNYTEIALLGSLDATGAVSVKNTKTIYPAGTFAGFDIDDVRVLGVALGAAHTISTYLNGEFQENAGDGGALVNGGFFTSAGRMITGFKTTKPFDEIQFATKNFVAVGASPVRVYGAVVKRFCAGPALSCNTNTKMTENIHPVFVDAKHTGIDALACLQCNIIDAGNALDSDPDNYTQIVIPVAVATTAAYAIADGATVYNADPAQKVFAGFDIENPNLIGADVLSGLSVATTLNGVLQETADMSSGLISAKTSPLNGTGRQTVGFLPSLPFDGVKIIFNSAVKANIGTTRIYNAIFKRFCETDLTCNTLTAAQNPGQPVYVNGTRTQIDAIGCVGCQLNNAENIVDESAALPATLIMGTGIGATASIAVANAIGTYPIESFAGFEIESATLLSADLLARINITLYNNGAPVQSGTGQSLLAGVNASLITGGPNRQIIGILSRAPFDEVQLNIQNLVGVNLGEILIYKAHFQKSCALAVSCNTNKLLNSAEDGAVINAAQTGVKGGICAGCLVNGPWDAVSESNTDYTRLYNTASALIANSLAVAAPAYTFPAGTFAGFTIKKNNFIVAAGIFPNITITTYNDGVQQEAKTGGSLIDLAILTQWLGTPNSIYTPGFYTSRPFDEIKITIGSLATALDQYVDVYGAYVSVAGHTAGAAGLNCNSASSDFSVGFINVTVEGNVSTNDHVQTGTQYGGLVTVPAGITNPSPGLPVVNPDGAYTFIATTPGVHLFEVSICPSTTSMNCPKELLTITIQDSTPEARNPPIANTDLAIAPFNATIIINTLHNDRLGSPGFALAPSSVTLTDLNGDGPGNTSAGGSAVPNPVTGDISYTPPTDFVGIDTIRYTVCDNQPAPQCASAYQIVDVYPPEAPNATNASDDFVIIPKNSMAAMSPAKGVLTNDEDPEGDVISVIPKDTVIAGQGRLQLYSDGSYIFTPVPEFTGTVTIPYTIQDDGVPMATAGATLYILIKSGPDLTPVLTITPAITHGNANIDVVVDVMEINRISTSGLITVNLTKSRLVTLDFNPAATVINGKLVQNSKWTLDAISNPNYYILKTSESIPAGEVISFGFSGILTPDATDGKINMTTIIMPGSGKETNSANNLDVKPISFYEH